MLERSPSLRSLSVRARLGLALPLALALVAGCAAGGDPGGGGDRADDVELDDERGDALNYQRWPVLRLGDSDRAIIAMQHLLNHHGAGLMVTGLFDDATDAAVREFQRSQRLGVDGIVGKNTWGKLVVTVREGASGDAVRAIQDMLLQGYEYTIEVNGQFDAVTADHVKKFQGDMCLRWVDAIVGPETWYTLVANASQCTGGGKPDTPVSGDAMSLAGRILDASDAGKVTLLTYNDGGNDGASAHDNITDVSQGLKAKISRYGNAPGGTTNLSVDLLAATDDYANNQGARFQVNHIAGGSHSKSSAHYRGQAIDFQVQGNASKLMKMCRNAGATLVLGPGDAGHSTHVHCQW